MSLVCFLERPPAGSVIEYFDGLYRRAAESYLKRCPTLQKRLGTLNDFITLQRLGDELTVGRLDLAPALGVVGNRTEVQLGHVVERIDRPLARMERARPFW